MRGLLVLALAGAALLAITAAAPVRAAPCSAYGNDVTRCTNDCACGFCNDDATCRPGTGAPTDGSTCSTAAWIRPSAATCDPCQARSGMGEAGCIGRGADCHECGHCTRTDECLTFGDDGAGGHTGPTLPGQSCTASTVTLPYLCPANVTDADCRRYTTLGECHADCRCGWCQSNNQCYAGTAAGPRPPYTTVCTSAGAWSWRTDPTLCDACLRYTNRDDCIGSGTRGGAAGVSNCGWCPVANRCLRGAPAAPATPPGNGLPCGTWVPPYNPGAPPAGGSGSGGSGGSVSCPTLTDANTCQGTCGCGWCYSTGQCAAANAVTGYPRDPGACPGAFGDSSGPRWGLNNALCRPALNERDPCRDIDPGQCPRVCGCGLCGLGNDLQQSVCMSGGSFGPAGTCPSAAGLTWNPPVGTGAPNNNNNTNNNTNSVQCVMATPVPDPCHAYPADASGNCEAHCGCGRCTDAATGESVCVTSRPDGSGPTQWGNSATTVTCRAGTWTAPPGYDAQHVYNGQSTSAVPCRGHSVNGCWRQPRSLCGASDGVSLWDDRAAVAAAAASANTTTTTTTTPSTSPYSWNGANAVFRSGCVWCDDDSHRGCAPAQPWTGSLSFPPASVGATLPPNFGPTAVRVQNGWAFVGRTCRSASRQPYAEYTPRCQQLSSRDRCAATCGCAWCGYAGDTSATSVGMCVRADPYAGRATGAGLCPAPKTLTYAWPLGCTPAEQAAAMAQNGDRDGDDNGGGSREQIGVDETSNLSLVAGCGAVLVASVVAFHIWHRSEEEEPTGQPIRLPFPDKTDSQRSERTCRKFVRLVQLNHPLTQLLYAASRDGFGRWRRLFCVVVAMSCQLTVVLACLLGLSNAISNAYPGIVSSVLSASVSFVYEKPIVRLVKFTARQSCCGSCANCCMASVSYCAIVSCFIQIPIVLVAFWLVFIRTGQVVVTFGFTQLMSAWAASVALGYLTQIPSLAVRFCLCPAKYTREINEYNRQYEHFDTRDLARLQAAAQRNAQTLELARAQGGDTNAVVAIAGTPKAATTAAATVGTPASAAAAAAAAAARAAAQHTGATPTLTGGTIAVQQNGVRVDGSGAGAESDATFADAAAAAAAAAVSELAALSQDAAAAADAAAAGHKYAVMDGAQRKQSTSSSSAAGSPARGGVAGVDGDAGAGVGAATRVSLNAGVPSEPGVAPEPQLLAGARNSSTRRQAFM